MSELLPGLPNNVALLCIARVPRIYHGALKTVSKQWKEIIDGEDFYSVRKKLGVTDETIFMVKNFDDSPGRLHSMEIDLKSRKCSNTLFVNDTVTSDMFIGGYGCASVGHLVLVFGGRDSKTLYVFNTLSRTWIMGAEMQCPRGEFGYGVIDGKFYIAGGYACRGIVTDAEVYDPVANAWSRIANMPSVMHVDIFCVWRKQLLVRGLTMSDMRHRVFLYSPARNEWKEQDWLVNLFSSFGASLATVVTTKMDDAIHFGFAEQSYEGRDMTDYVNVVRVKKLDSKTLKWKSVVKYRDEGGEHKCECGSDGMHLPLFGLKDRVLVLRHLDAEDHRTFKLLFSKGVVKLYIDCPSAWTSTVVDA